MNIGMILGLIPAIFGIIQQLMSLFHTGQVDTNALGTDAVAVLTGAGVVHTSSVAKSNTQAIAVANAAVDTVKQAQAIYSSKRAGM